MDLSEIVYQIPLWLNAVFMLLLLLLAAEAGYRGGARVRAKRGKVSGGELGAIQGAILGLLGLLLAFTYSLAANRSDARHELVVKEANAIGTAYLRAGLAPEPSRGRLQGILRAYVSTRLVPDDVATHPARQAAAIRTSEQTLAKLWPTLAIYLDGRPPTVLDGLLVQAFNDVIDVHSERVAAGRYRVPPVIVWLLIGVAMIALLVAGWSSGLEGERSFVFVVTLAVLIVAVTMVTVDLDNTRRGLITISQQPLIELRDSLEAEAAGGAAPPPSGRPAPR